MKNNILKIKQQLLNACLLFVNKNHETITNIIESNKNDLLSETKSSAGDKHETGRAMIQLEMEKAGQQLVSINVMKEILSKVSIEKTSELICLGSLVYTSKANYFLAISTGKLVIENEDYFVVSAQSPIGKQLLGKKIGDIIVFNAAQILEVF